MRRKEQDLIRVVLASPDSGGKPLERLRLANIPGIAFEVTDLAGIRDAVASIDPHVLWVDAENTVPAAQLDRLLAADPPVLLTRAAIPLAANAGWVPGAPNNVIDSVWQDDENELVLPAESRETRRVRGHACFRRHRLFEGTGGGLDTWRPKADEPFRAWTWRRPRWPNTARVIAVERAFMRINPDRATIWEYPLAAVRPHILCVGAYLPLETGDPSFRLHVDCLLRNALVFLAGGLPAPRPDLYWVDPDNRSIEDNNLDIPVTAPELRPEAGGDPDPLPLEISPLQIAGACDEEPFTVAGRRALVAGVEERGTEEIWIHPLRVVKAMRLPDARCLEVVVTPLGVERTLGIANVHIVERIFVPGEAPAAIFEFERLPHSEPPENVAFRVEWATDLRLMWPYPAESMGPLHWRSTANALLIRSGRTGESVCFVASVMSPTGAGSVPVTGPEAEHPATIRFTADNGAEDERGSLGAQLRCTLTCNLTPGARLRLTIAGSTGDDDDLAATLRSLRKPSSLVRARAGSHRRLQRERLAVDAPDPHIGTAIEWAKVHLDSCRAESPGLGRSLLAGYRTGRPGSNDGRQGWREGRPGSAWSFGRDSVWTALGSLACGDFGAGRDVVNFLGQHQDVSGEILHAWTSSGAVQFAATDSTLLYLLLVARYFAWTGDGGFVQSQWEQVRRAFDFCVPTDRNGDGLTVTTRARDDRIELGGPGGGELPYHDAGIRATALRELSGTAESIGDARFAAELDSWAVSARLAVEKNRDPAHGRGAVVWPVFSGWAAWAESSGDAVSPFVYGLLGAVPDAANGRLRLRPRIPDGWDRLEVRNIRMGEASVHMAYERRGTAHIFTADQDEGAVPIRLILEPALPGVPASARVDGQPAQLQPQAFGDRVIVPVQLVLDHQRLVEIETEPQ